VTALVWDSEGYHLVAVSKGSTTIADFSFCKSVLCRGFSQSKSSSVVLQSSDKLLRFHMSSGTDFVSADWEPLQIPLSYLAFNYPIRNVAISNDRNHIALSGRKGCVIYSGTAKKWRMFGNLEQEFQVQCTGMVWIDNTVLAMISRNEKNESELLLYPRYHLDESSRLARQTITNCKIIFMDSTSVLLRITKDQIKLVPIIFMYDETMKLHIYTCPIEYEKNNVHVNLGKLDVIDMSEYHTTVPRSMVSVSCKSNCGLNSSESKKLLSSVRLLFLHANGDLGAFKLHGTSRKEYILETGIDGLWIDTEQSYLDRIVYFTFNGKSKRGTDMSIVDLSSLPKCSHIRIRDIIPFDSEAVPMGVLKDFGVFLQISERVKHRICAPLDKEITSSATSKIAMPSPRFNSRDLLFMENPSGLPYYEMQPKMYPYIHGLLLGLLFEMKDENFESLKSFARNLQVHKDSPLTFAANLEWMLHSVLGGSEHSANTLSVESINVEDGVTTTVDLSKLIDQISNQSQQMIDYIMWSCS